MRNHIAFALLAALATIACGPTLRYERDPAVRIAPASSWAWMEPDRDGLTLREGAIVPNDTVAGIIARAIEAELIARGFNRVPRDSAQFLVHFHVGQRVLQDTLPILERGVPTGGTEPGDWGVYGRPEQVGERAVTWEEGMLIVDGLTPDGRVVAWRGTIAGEIPARAAKEPGKAIRAAVERLMRGFP